jgi:shikimate dehydrogenase|tara:strand:- start:1509 stop:2249 length:741 start_codon:yes stop_codon:yes gene_type:complete
MTTLGLIGFPVNHSKSPEYFLNKLKDLGKDEHSYAAFELEDINDFPAFLEQNPDLVGLNITIPHKETIIPFLDHIDCEAKEIGAVNTIVKTEKGWVGYNTDFWGFRRSMQPFLKGRHERAIILGTGGASKAVGHALRGLGVSTTIVSRTSSIGDICYSDLTKEAMSHHLLIVNCTPVGTWPDVELCVDIPFEGLTDEHLVVDLVYNPETTTFMKKASHSGASVMNGKDMLRLQAEKSLEIWIKNGL